MSENEQESIYEKYSVFIENLELKFKEISSNIEKNWDGENAQTLVKNLTKMTLQLRQLCNDLKHASGDERLSIYSIVIGNIIENLILRSEKIDEDDKLVIESAFGLDGVVESIIEEVSNFYKEQLINMDADKNNYVSRREYKDYLTLKAQCCCGETSNCSKCCKSCCKGYAKCTSCCVATTCFPLLSCCNKKGIQIKK